MAKPLRQARSNRQDKHTWSARPHRGASIVQARPSRSHSLPDGRMWHSGRTLRPPSTKQSQVISSPHEQARLECTPTPRCKHCPRKPIRASTRHPLSLPARRTSPSLWPNPSAKHEAIAKTSTLGVHAHTEVQALSKHAHPALTPCPTVGCGTPAEPFVHQAQSNRKLSRLLTNKPAWSARPHRGASIVRASPSEHQLDTRSHSLPDGQAHRYGQTPPPSTKQSPRQAHLECTPTPRCKHCPSTPIPLSLLARRSDVALRPNPSSTKHKAIASYLVSSRTSPLGVHAHTEVQALSAQSPSEHQLDTHSHSPPAAGGGTPPAPTPKHMCP
ncbi:uncharacterized protein LOC127146809 isoform X2 [Cucumis melo]|uniref:Uncharacterized protein LOC127146809 isoform X2 n=2 Tax=Cucumis melo TaxID=3656 RepID=A0ABM3KG52_CUCME|nr:uncharacterized protein LOC127146809 isoform X2 [Cucumis melo]